MSQSSSASVSYSKVAHLMLQSLGVVVKYAIHSSKFLFLPRDSLENGNPSRLAGTSKKMTEHSNVSNP